MSKATGYTDKNGKEICEGDIFRDKSDGAIEYDITSIVKWNEVYHAWYLQNIKEPDTHFDEWLDVFASDGEVIGNITDNPELLKGSTNNEMRGYLKVYWDKPKESEGK